MGKSLIYGLVLSTMSLFGLLNNALAQESLGFNLSNYSPANAVQLNPALIADSKTMVDIHLAGGSFFGYNDHTYFPGKGPGLFPALMGKQVLPLEMASMENDIFFVFNFQFPGFFPIFHPNRFPMIFFIF